MTLTRYMIPGPFKGIITDLPAASDKQVFDDLTNMVCRHGRLQSRPQWVEITAPPDGYPIKGMYTFQDALNNYHTIVLTTYNAYFVKLSGGVYSYLLLGNSYGLTNIFGTGLPYSFIEMDSKFFFCNGSVPIMYSDGSANIQLAGDVPGSALYLTENAQQLIGAGWTTPSLGITGSTQYPNLISWSDTANPLGWTSGLSSTAGSIDSIEAGGIITGLSTIGRNTYVLRKVGASVLYPTGNASPAYSLEPYMWSKPGWGNFYPYSLVTYGPFNISVTESAEVLMFDGSNFTQLSSGKVRGRLAADLALVDEDVVYGFATASMGPGYDFEAYWLSIPGPNVTWVHNLKEGTWQRFTSSYGWLTTSARVAVQ